MSEQPMSDDPVTQAKADLRELILCLAEGEQFPDLWDEFPAGSREALEIRARTLQAFLRLAKAGRVQSAPSPSAVQAFVRRVHRRCEEKAQALLERRLNRALPSPAHLILSGRSKSLQASASAARRMRSA